VERIRDVIKWVVRMHNVVRVDAINKEHQMLPVVQGGVIKMVSPVDNVEQGIVVNAEPPIHNVVLVTVVGIV